MQDRLAYKSSFNGDIRRFWVDSSLAHLEEKLCSMYPSLCSTNFKVLWTDTDGDRVVVSSDTELKIALSEMPGPVYRISVEQIEGSHRPLWGGVSVRCAECREGVPADERMYRCLVCPDWSLCTRCEAQGRHPVHNLLVSPPLHQAAAHPPQFIIGSCPPVSTSSSHATPIISTSSSHTNPSSSNSSNDVESGERRDSIPVEDNSDNETALDSPKAALDAINDAVDSAKEWLGSEEEAVKQASKAASAVVRRAHRWLSDEEYVEKAVVDVINDAAKVLVSEEAAQKATKAAEDTLKAAHYWIGTEEDVADKASKAAADVVKVVAAVGRKAEGVFDNLVTFVHSMLEPSGGYTEPGHQRRSLQTPIQTTQPASCADKNWNMHKQTQISNPIQTGSQAVTTATHAVTTATQSVTTATQPVTTENQPITTATQPVTAATRLVTSGTGESPVRTNVDETKTPTAPMSPNIQVALDSMLSMGFTNEEDWLRHLLETMEGDIGKVLDILLPPPLKK